MDDRRQHDTRKRHRLHGTVLSGFSYRIIDCYGIPGSKWLLAYTVPFYRKWYNIIPLAYTVYRVTDDYGTVNTITFTVLWQRIKPRLQLVIRILDPIDQYTTPALPLVNNYYWYILGVLCPFYFCYPRIYTLALVKSKFPL